MSTLKPQQCTKCETAITGAGNSTVAFRGHHGSYSPCLRSRGTLQRQHTSGSWCLFSVKVFREIPDALPRPDEDTSVINPGVTAASAIGRHFHGPCWFYFQNANQVPQVFLRAAQHFSGEIQRPVTPVCRYREFPCPAFLRQPVMTVASQAVIFSGDLQSARRSNVT